MRQCAMSFGAVPVGDQDAMLDFYTEKLGRRGQVR
jgi:hypothetical protein